MDVFENLTADEKKVLWWKYKKNYTHPRIAEKMFHKPDWVQGQVSSVYAKLEMDTKGRHWTAIEKEFREKYLALIPEKLEDFLAPPVTPAEQREEPDQPEQPGQPEEPKEDPKVIYGKVEERPRTTPRHWPSWVVGIFTTVITCLVLVVVASLASKLPQPTPTPTSVVMPVASQLSAQVFPTQIPATVQLLPAATSAAPASLPSATIAPVKDFYFQGEFATLRDGVFIRLMPDFDGPSTGACPPPNPGFTVVFELRKSTTGEFLLRFDPSTFHAQDDLGNVYALEGAGINTCGAIGPQQVQASDYTYMRAKFSGQIPLNAQYIIITADSLSGVKLVFHKSL